MPKSCVVKKMKAGTSPLKSIKECYPDATAKAVKVIKNSFITPKVIKAVKKHIALKQIKKSKPKELKLRRKQLPPKPNDLAKPNMNKKRKKKDAYISKKLLMQQKGY